MAELVKIPCRSCADYVQSADSAGTQQSGRPKAFFFRYQLFAENGAQKSFLPGGLSD